MLATGCPCAEKSADRREAVLRLACEGEGCGLENIRVTAYNHFRVRGCSHEDSEDLAQEVLVRIVRRAKRSRREITIGWSRSLARDIFREYWRKKKRRQSKASKAPEESTGTLEVGYRMVELKSAIAVIKRVAELEDDDIVKVLAYLDASTRARKQAVADELGLSVDELRTEAERVLDRARRIVRARHPDLADLLQDPDHLLWVDDDSL